MSPRRTIVVSSRFHRLSLSTVRAIAARTFLCALVAVALAVAASFSAGRAAAGDAPVGAGAAEAPPPSAGELVRTPQPGALRVAPGGTAELVLEFEVLHEWHVNAHQPNEDFLVPTVLTLPRVPGLTFGAPRYPEAKQAQLAFSETPLAVYEGRFRIVVPVTVAADAVPGVRTVAAKLRFQACDNQVCLPPASVPAPASVTVEGGPGAGSGTASDAGPTPGTAPADTTTAGAPADTPSSPAAGFETAPPPGGGSAGAAGGAGPKGGTAGTNLVGQWFAERGAPLAFLLIFLMGLALNLTPCVYPMMGVTISLFGGGAGAAGGMGGAGAGAAGGAGGTRVALAALPRAIVYVLGIALMYSTLGVIAAMTGGLFGGWLSNPWVLGAIGLLLLAMALSMFGLYEMQAPSALLSRLGGATGTGYIGTFLAGLLVGVFAAPCIGPPIIALLAHVGAKGDPVFGFWAFFVLSMGLGLPYLVLAVFSGLMTRLPRAGSWMEWVKHLFGVVLLGVAAFYLVLALAPSFAPWVLPVTLGLGGLYLGFLEPTGRDRVAFRRFKWAVGVIAIAIAPLMAARLQATGVEFEPFSEAALAQATARGQVVLLDFAADWCIPCHELEEMTFTDRRVIDAVRPFARFKVDLTEFDAEGSVALRKRFAIQGVPTLVFLGPDGREVESARVVGFMKPEPFLERVRLAAAGGAGAGAGAEPASSAR